MHDLSYFRSNFERIAERLATRGGAIDLQGFRDLDHKRRSAISLAEQLKARKNQESVEIGKLKRAGADTTQRQKEVRPNTITRLRKRRISNSDSNPMARARSTPYRTKAATPSWSRDSHCVGKDFRR